MSRLPDIVRDSKLEARISGLSTEHFFIESGSIGQPRTVRRTEHWEDEKCIGRGGYGSVWLQKCVMGGNEITQRAVKKIPKRQQRHYHRELEAIAKFSHSKYVRCFAESFGWYEDNETLFITMEYFPDGDLHQFLSDKPPLSEKDTRNVTSQVLEGLSFMHDNGFSHRDLKPSNILIKSKPPGDWWVKISDFGFSKRVDETSISMSVKGTAGFLAPEIHGFVEVSDELCTLDSQASDIWSLGEVIFRMMTSKPAFKNTGQLAKYVHNPNMFPLTALSAFGMSNDGRDFVQSIMRPLPGERLTAAEALSHSWIAASFLFSPLTLMSRMMLSEHRQAALSIVAVMEPSAQWSFIQVPDEAAHSQKLDKNLPRTFSSEVQIQKELLYLVVAVDYGTNWTSVAYGTISKDTACCIVSLDDVRVLQQWPTGSTVKVPSLISYSPASELGETQWGHDITENALVNKWTKRELDLPRTRLDGLQSIFDVVLELEAFAFEFVSGTRSSDRPAKSPEDIVTDYLAKIFEFWSRRMASRGRILERVPLRIIATVPVHWSYKGGNSLFRAIRNAGLNMAHCPTLTDVMLVPEIDAAAMYAARTLRESVDCKKRFELGENFILCYEIDSMVETASYKVIASEPSLSLERMTTPTSAIGGYELVDEDFNIWFRGIVREAGYPEENLTYIMDILISRFERFRTCFSKNYCCHIDLPDPDKGGFQSLQGTELDEHRLHEMVEMGTLYITGEEMASFFSSSMSSIVNSISEQRQQVELDGNQINDVLLVGYFFSTPFVLEDLRGSPSLCGLNFYPTEHRGEEIVGAVLYGSDGYDHGNIKGVRTHVRSLGIKFESPRETLGRRPISENASSATNVDMADNISYHWIIRKGDLFEPRNLFEEKFAANFQTNDNKILEIAVDEYQNIDRSTEGSSGIEGAQRVALVACDFSSLPIDNFDRFHDNELGRIYHVAYCICTFLLSETSLTIKVQWNNTESMENIVPIKPEHRDIILTFGSCRSIQQMIKLTQTLPQYLDLSSKAMLFEIKDKIRTRYKLDRQIWNLRSCHYRDRPVVERLMEQADDLLAEIRLIMQGWIDGAGTYLWTPEELDKVHHIRMRLSEGQRIWSANPPWDEE